MAIITPHSQRSHLRPVSVFCSYAHSDEPFRAQLDKHLSVMRRNNEIVVWYDLDIGAGTNWKTSIDHHLDTSEIILLLVSADFFKSGYCSEIEMERALQRVGDGKARVIPILLRDCDWQSTPLYNLQVLPPGAKPINDWVHEDEAYNLIVSELRKVVSEIRGAVSVELTARPSEQSNRRIVVALASLLAVLLVILGAYHAGIFDSKDTKAIQPTANNNEPAANPTKMNSTPESETNVLYGDVVDEKNKELPGVTIRLIDFPNLPSAESSAPWGRFIIEGVPKKRGEFVRIEASKKGYVTSKEPYVVGPITLHIMLEKER